MSTETSDKGEARKGGGISSKLFATAIIILVLAISALGYYAYTLRNANSSLNEQLADLSKNYTSLNAQYESLKANYMSLDTRCNSLEANYTLLNSQYGYLLNNYTSLKADYTSLEANYTSLKNQYDSLMANYTSLNAQYNSLLSNYNNLEVSYTSLKNQYDSLLSNYNSLEAAYNDLANKYSNAQAIINLAVSRTLEKDKPVQIPAGSSTYLAYSLNYAGYLVITFSANGNIYFYVGGNGTYGSYSIRYPYSSSFVASSGSFIVPVLPGTTYVNIYNPSIVFGVSVTITITYVY